MGKKMINHDIKLLLLSVSFFSSSKLYNSTQGIRMIFGNLVTKAQRDFWAFSRDYAMRMDILFDYIYAGSEL